MKKKNFLCIIYSCLLEIELKFDVYFVVIWFNVNVIWKMRILKGCIL